jgi:ABC-type branched-subunit amino acid transport system substrate-binding protein
MVTNGDKTEGRWLMLSHRSAISGLAVLGLAASLAACGSSSSGGSSTASSGHLSGTFYVASPADETGSDSLCGLQWVQAVKAAENYVNATGGVLGEKMVVDFEDVQSNPATAAQVTASMISSGKYKALIPTVCGAESGPVLSAANRAKLLFVGAASVGALGEGSAYPDAFNTGYSPTQTAVADACLALSFKPKTAAILALNDSYTQDTVTGVAAKLRANGIKIVADEQIAFTDLNVTTELQAIQAAHPDIVIIDDYSTSMHAIFSALKTLNYKPPILMGDGTTSTVPIQPFADGALPNPFYALSYPSAARPASGLTAAQRNLVDYLRKEGAIQGDLSGYYYPWDAALLIRWAADQSKSTSTPAMVKALETLNSDTSANPGTEGEPRPPYTVSNHYYGPTSDYYPYFEVNLSVTPQSATFTTVKQIKPC